MISHVKKQIDLVLILRTTHRIVDDGCNQVRCKDLEMPLPSTSTVGFILRQIYLRYVQVLDL